MKLAYIGTGYVGLVNGTVTADAGNTVLCVDKDSARITMLHNLEMPIYELGLQELVRKNVAAGRLKFSTNLREAVLFADVLFICVGTPSLPDGSADLSAVFDVAENIAKIMQAENITYRLVVTRSTIPVGTSDEIHKKLAKILPKESFDVAMNPEFLQEGVAVQNATHPDRVVVGVNSVRAEKILKELYDPFVKSGAPIRVMSPSEAELVKYVANTRLAVQLSFQNECAALCDVFYANIRQVLQAVTDDPRIGKKFAHPSGGYGGSCFPKDVKALVYAAKKAGADLSVAHAADVANENMKRMLLNKMMCFFGDDIVGKTFAVWGLAFKAGTDDAREAPAITIIEGLLEKGAKVRAYDPKAIDFVRNKTSIGERITYVDNAKDVLFGADALVICTEWPEFAAPDFAIVKSMIKQPVIFDNKSLFDPIKMTELGFTYFGVGVENELARSYRKLGK